MGYNPWGHFHFHQNIQNFSGSYIHLLFFLFSYFSIFLFSYFLVSYFSNQTIIFLEYPNDAPLLLIDNKFLISLIQILITGVVVILAERNLLLPHLCPINASWPPLPVDTSTGPSDTPLPLPWISMISLK